MVTLSTVENVLQSDKVPVFMGVNRLYLKKGLQSTSRNVDVPSDVVREQGNRLNRGTSIKPAQIKVSMEDLSVDMDIEQLFSESFTTLKANLVTVASAGSSGLVTSTAGRGSGVMIKVVGPTDNINCLVLTYYSGTASGTISVGEGAPVKTVVNSSKITVSSSFIDNFAVGDTVLFVGNRKANNLVTSTISGISGSQIQLTTGTVTASSYTAANSGFIMVYDSNPINTKKWVNGRPNASVKGIEVFNYNKRTPYNALAGRSIVSYQLLSAAGTTTANTIDSDTWRDTNVDILMLYNDIDGNLLFTRYIQDAAPTSIAYNFTGDGNATQSYEFTSSKSLDFVGYVVRKSTILASAATNPITSVDLDATTSALFTGSESPIAITKNTTLNTTSFDKYFLKLTTTTSAGVRVNWNEVSGTLSEGQFSYAPTTKTVTFKNGTTIAAPGKGNRLEITYLCAAANVDTGSLYSYSATAFTKHGVPDVVTGGYQPLTINTNNFTNRVDGIESSSFTVALNRDYYNAQGTIAPVVKPAMVGTIDGSFSTKEGYCRTMNAITSGVGYSYLTANTQFDASKAALYTNKKTIPLRVRLFDPADNTTVIKTLNVDAIQVTAINNTNSVDGDSGFEVNFTSKNGRILVDRFAS